MKQNPWKKLISLCTAIALCLSMTVLPVMAVPDDFANVSEDGGANVVNLTQPRSFKASVAVDMTLSEAKAAAEKVVWSLVRDEDQQYLSDTLYPNQTEGGPLDSWLCADDETAFFTDIVSGAEQVDGKTYLTVSFNSVCYFGDDRSTPYINTTYSPGGDCMDVCGYFDLTAILDGEAQGSAPVKIVPYDQFHTMAEIYDEIDKMVDFAAENTDLYVERFSMGKSQGSNGMEKLDMPYLIVAKSEAAVNNWKSIKAEAESDPSGLIKKLENGTLKDYQVPVLYSNIHANEISAVDGVLNFAWLLLNTAAGSGKTNYDVLTGFTAEGEAELARELGEAGAEGSVAVPDLVKDSATYLGYLHVDNVQENEWGAAFRSDVVDLEKYYTIEEKTVDVDALLNDVFFIIVPEENVEGRTYLIRESSGGFDLNRDNSFQTQAETQNMTRLIAQWNPVSFTEFHGRVEAFQFEPCDPPHEPNFEYDLLAEHLMTGGEAMGIAAVANNPAHNSYVIPQRDYLSYTGEKNADGSFQTQWYDPWDDMSTSYTPQYAMLHGTVSYTVEVPAYNDETATAVTYAALGGGVYVAENKMGYLLNQTKIFERGVTNFNSNAYDLVGQWFCDQYDVEGAEAELFRPEYDGEGQNGNFYPECYIIPLDGANQKNLDAADEMITYLIRNGVKVMFADEAFTYDGTEYPAGTAVVSMYQAKRSVANGVLYDGTVITGWPVLYSEGITAFNKTRGFDMATCAEPEAYKAIAGVCTEKDADAYTAPASAFTGVENEKVILSNASEDSTAAVNALLKAGKDVGMIVTGGNKGSFVISYADWQTVAEDYLLTGVGVADADAPLSLRITAAPVVYISGKADDNASGFVKAALFNDSYEYNYDQQSLALMGFQTTEDAAKATLVVGAAAMDDAAVKAVKGGTAYIGYGSSAISSVAKSGLLPEGSLVRQVVSRSSMDALAYVTYEGDSMVTASYVAEGDDILYGYGAGYFETIPTGAQVLIRMDGSKELLEGFLVGTGEHFDDFKNNSIQAISYQKNGLNMVLFANTLTQKVHQRDEFAFISNMAFSSLLGGIYTGSVKSADDAKAVAAARYSDVSSSDWFAGDVGNVTVKELMNGVSASTFGPNGTLNRQTVATVLYRAANSPEVSGSELDNFSDAGSIASWAKDAMLWAVQEGILEGSNGKLQPLSTATRQQLAAIFYRAAGSHEVNSSTLDSFVDNGSIASWASDAAEWCVANDIIRGVGGNTFAPNSSATRAQLAAMLLRYQDAN